MQRMRKLRAKISPADGHAGTAGTGAHVFQGRGRFVDANTIEVNGTQLKFRKADVRNSLSAEGILGCFERIANLRKFRVDARSALISPVPRLPKESLI